MVLKFLLCEVTVIANECPQIELSAQEFCSVGDDSCLIFWDARVGTAPCIKASLFLCILFLVTPVWDSCPKTGLLKKLSLNRLRKPMMLISIVLTGIHTIKISF